MRCLQVARKFPTQRCAKYKTPPFVLFRDFPYAAVAAWITGMKCVFSCMYTYMNTIYPDMSLNARGH